MLSNEDEEFITLPHLVTTNSHTTMGMDFRMSSATVGNIVKESSGATLNLFTWNNYPKDFLLDEEMIQIATDFEKKWNFANYFMGIDEKHVIQTLAQVSCFTIISVDIVLPQCSYKCQPSDWGNWSS